MSGSEVMTPTVRFKPGTDQAGATGYDVPKDTLDPRYAACTDHRVACDCREAERAETIAELLAELQEYRRAFEAFWRAAPYDVTRQARIAWKVAQHGMYPYYRPGTDAADQDARHKALLRIANDKNLTPEQARDLAHTALGFDPGEAGTPRVGVLEEIDAEPPF